MKYLFLFLTLLITSCSNIIEPPHITSRNIEQNIDQVEYNFIGTYITEDLKNNIEIFENQSFAYKLSDDYTTWRIGLWNYQDNIISVKYEDGGECQIIPYENRVIYCEGDTIIEFLRSVDLNITVTIDPKFNN